MSLISWSKSPQGTASRRARYASAMGSSPHSLLRFGGVTGKRFVPGQSGNPGGRPKGLARRVREIVGDDGEAITTFMFGVMNDGSARNADRIEAAKWLADRGFGRAVQTFDIDMNPSSAIDITRLSTPDLEALRVMLRRYEPNADEIVESGELRLRTSAAPAAYRRR